MPKTSDPEYQLQSRCVAILKLRGWLTYHTWDSRRSEKGFPDLVAEQKRQLLVVEFKDDGKYPTPEQAEWLARFSDIPGVITLLVKPHRTSHAYLYPQINEQQFCDMFNTPWPPRLGAYT